MGWSAVNLHDGANDVLPALDEYDKFYDFGNDDVYYDDDREEEMNEDDIVLDSNITLGNDIRGDDNVVNTAFEISIAENYDVPFISAGCEMGSVPIASNYDVSFVPTGCETGSVPIASNTEHRHRHDPIRNENDSGKTRAQTSQVVS